jgi:hypothetical protein
VTLLAGTNTTVTAQSAPTGPNTAAILVDTFAGGVASDVAFNIHVDILPQAF